MFRSVLGTQATNRAMRGLANLSQHPLIREGAPLLGVYWLYSLVRWFVAHDNAYAGFENAYRVIDLEQRLGLFYEPIVQRKLIDGALSAVHFSNWFYTFGYFPVLLLAGVLLYRFDRRRFQTFKLTFFLGLGFALICFSLFPLAPPRMLPELGFVDTQLVYGSALYHQKSVISFYNPYAAMPSLHFGWALLVGIMLFTSDRRALKVLGLLYPCFMAVVIVTTGHHYILDIVVGGAIVGSAYRLVNQALRGKSAPSPVTAGAYRVSLHGKDRS
jgi:hypothetical protein